MIFAVGDWSILLPMFTMIFIFARYISIRFTRAEPQFHKVD